MNYYDEIMNAARVAVNDMSETFSNYYNISNRLRMMEELYNSSFMTKEGFVLVYQRALIHDLYSAVWLRQVNNRNLADRKVLSEADTAQTAFEKMVKHYFKKEK
jgi:hypothetical protein